jgi:hypothetical protein
MIRIRHHERSGEESLCMQMKHNMTTERTYRSISAFQDAERCIHKKVTAE